MKYKNKDIRSFFVLFAYLLLTALLLVLLVTAVGGTLTWLWLVCCYFLSMISKGTRTETPLFIMSMMLG